MEALTQHEPGEYIGPWFINYLDNNLFLPRRLRRDPEDFDNELFDRLFRPRHHWETDLAERLNDFGLSFTPVPEHKTERQIFSIKELGFARINGRWEPQTPALIKERDRLLVERS